jgi:fructose-bisphosphate aldolase class 1
LTRIIQVVAWTNASSSRIPRRLQEVGCPEGQESRRALRLLLLPMSRLRKIMSKTKRKKASLTPRVRRRLERLTNH